MKKILCALFLATNLIAQNAWISPNTRLIHTQAVQITQVDARIDLADQIATMTLDIALRDAR